MLSSKISKHFPSFQILQMTERVHILIYTQICTLSRKLSLRYIISTKAHMGKGHVHLATFTWGSPMASKRQCSTAHPGDHRDHPSRAHMLSAGNRQRNVCWLWKAKFERSYSLRMPTWTKIKIRREPRKATGKKKETKPPSSWRQGVMQSPQSVTFQLQLVLMKHSYIASYYSLYNRSLHPSIPAFLR